MTGACWSTQVPRSAASFETKPDRFMLAERLLEWLQKPVASEMEVGWIRGVGGVGVELLVSIVVLAVLAVWVLMLGLVLAVLGSVLGTGSCRWWHWR